MKINCEILNREVGDYVMLKEYSNKFQRDFYGEELQQQTNLKVDTEKEEKD